jgi:hypothetical protein
MKIFSRFQIAVHSQTIYCLHKSFFVALSNLGADNYEPAYPSRSSATITPAWISGVYKSFLTITYPNYKQYEYTIALDLNLTPKGFLILHFDPTHLLFTVSPSSSQLQIK